MNDVLRGARMCLAFVSGRFAALVVALALYAVPTLAAEWVPLAGISATSTLVTNSLCYTDGTDLVCDGTAGSVGSLGATDRIVSGTTNVQATSGGLINFTTGGVTTGYFNTAGLLVAPGVSLTSAHGISSTNGYFSGNVGVGLTAPLAKLDVSNDLRVTRPGVAVQYVELINAGANGGELNNYSTITNKKRLYLSSLYTGTGTPAGSTDIIFRVGSSTTPLEVMRMMEDGNVAIGNINPSAKLHVTGTGKFTNTLDMTSQRILNLGTPTASTDAATKAYVDSAVGGVATDRIVSGTTNVRATSGGLINFTTGGVTTGYFNTAGLLVAPGVSLTTHGISSTNGYFSGNVGIGTSNFWKPLSVYSASTSALIQVQGVGDTSNFSGIEFFSEETTDKAWAFYHKKQAGLLNGLTLSYWNGSNNNTTMFFSSSGNVGIGTTSPSAKLHVTGTGKFTGAVDMTSQKITSLGTPTASTDAATKAYVDTTAADAAAAAADNLGNHTATQNLNMANRKIVSLAGPTAGTDAATKAYVDLTAASAASAAADNLGNHTATQNLNIGGYNIVGSNGLLLETNVASGVLDDGTSDAPYSRVHAHSFHTQGTGLGQMYIEGYAIDANMPIRIGKGLAGGQSAQDVEIGDNTEIYVDTSANSVGIGTWSPSAKLHVAGTGKFTGAVDMTSQKITSLGTPTASTDAATKAYVDTTAADAAAAAADNLGNHTATQTLAMGAYAITSSAGTIRDANGGWVRTYGNTGWYNGTYQGGWYMNDTDWLRAYNNKNIITGGVMRADGGFNVDGFQTINANGSELQLRHTDASGFTSIRMDGADSTKTLRLHYGGSSDNVLRFGSYADNFSATWHANPVRFDLDAPDGTLVVEEAGSVKIGGQLNVSSNKIINVAAPTAAQDAATKAYVDTAVAAGGGDADTLSGMSATSAATASTIMARDGNADTWVRYLNSVHVNMSHSAATRNADTVFYSSTDNYIRKNNAAGFRTSLDVYSKGEATGLFVPTGRTLTAGTGITGGGDLSANRTFSFDTTWGDARYTNKAGDTMTGNLFFSGGTRYTGTSSNNNFVVRTNNTDRLTITAAGAATFSGNLTVGGTLSMGGSKVTNVAAPTAAQDAATKAYVDANTGGIPTGAIMAFDLASCPTGWSEYTAARGRFLRGIDSTGAVDPDGVRTAGSIQNDALKSHKHASVVIGSTGLYMGSGAGGTGSPSGNTYIAAGGGTNAAAETSTVGGDETRPKNVAVLYCRKN